MSGRRVHAHGAREGRSDGGRDAVAVRIRKEHSSID